MSGEALSGAALDPGRANLGTLGVDVIVPLRDGKGLLNFAQLVNDPQSPGLIDTFSRRRRSAIISAPPLATISAPTAISPRLGSPCKAGRNAARCACSADSRW